MKSAPFSKMKFMVAGAIQQWQTPAPKIGGMPLGPVSEQVILSVINDPTSKGNMYVQILLNQFKGKLDIERLQQAYQAMVDRHDALRTTFQVIDGALLAEVHAAGSVKSELKIINMLDVEAGSPSVMATLVDIGNAPMDLTVAPLGHLTLVCVAEDRYLLQLRYCHGIMDGTSHLVWLNELSALYNGKKLPKVQYQYSQFAGWQRNFLDPQSTGVIQQLKYWNQKLQGAPELLELPTDCPRPPVCSFLGKIYSSTISTDLYDKIKTFMEDNRQSPWRIVLAAYVYTLQAYSQQPEAVVAMPRTTRLPTMANVLGHFANFVPLRLCIDNSMTFLDICKYIGAVMKEASANGDVTFQSIIKECRPVRSQAYVPVAQASVSVIDQGNNEMGHAF